MFRLVITDWVNLSPFLPYLDYSSFGPLPITKIDRFRRIYYSRITYVFFFKSFIHSSVDRHYHGTWFILLRFRYPKVRIRIQG